MRRRHLGECIAGVEGPNEGIVTVAENLQNVRERTRVEEGRNPGQNGRSVLGGRAEDHIVGLDDGLYGLCERFSCRRFLVATRHVHDSLDALGHLCGCRSRQKNKVVGRLPLLCRRYSRLRGPRSRSAGRQGVAEDPRRGKAGGEAVGTRASDDGRAEKERHGAGPEIDVNDENNGTKGFLCTDSHTEFITLTHRVQSPCRTQMARHAPPTPPPTSCRSLIAFIFSFTIYDCC